MKPLTWKQNTSRYGASESLYCGVIELAVVFYNSCRSKDDPFHYAVTVNLPCLKNKGHEKHETKEKAKERAEQMVKGWLQHMGCL